MGYLKVNLICDTSRDDFKINTKQRILKLFNEYGGQFYESIELNESNRRKVFDEDGFAYFDDCKLMLRKLSSDIIHKMLIHFCKTELFYGLYMNLAREDFELDLLSSLTEQPLHRFKLKEEFAYFSLGTIVNMCTFVPHFISSKTESHSRDVIVEFEHDIKELNVYFRVKKSEKSCIRYKMQIHYENINSYIFSSNDHTIAVYVTLLFPPNLYTEHADNYETRVRHCEEKTGSDIWIRSVSFPGIESDVYGKCNVLKFEIPLIKNQEKIRNHVKIDCPWSLIKCLPKFVETPSYFAFIRNWQQINSKDVKIHWDKECKLDEIQKFDLCWALDCIQSHSFQFVDELQFLSKKSMFNKIFNKYAKEDSNALENALYLVHNFLQKSPLLNILDSFQILFEKLKSDTWKEEESLKQKAPLLKNMVNLRRIAITPTRILYLPKQPFRQTIFCHGPPENAKENDRTNTLYRADYTVSAVVKNDDFEPLSYSLNRKPIPGIKSLKEAKKERQLSQEEKMRLVRLEEKADYADKMQSDFLNECFRKRLINGLTIQNRRYEYLSSHLRNDVLYLYAKDCYNMTASDLRKSFGNIQEKNIAKYIARVSLAFSGVQHFIDLSEFEKNGSKVIRMIPDIKGGPNEKYTFSDGVGMISLPLATKIYEKLKHTRFMSNLEEPPSVFQIRIGGCKGILMTNPNLKGDQILIRQESMKKYDSENMNLLGIIRVSNISALHLNKQFVTLLDQLGSDRNYMCELLSSHLKKLSKAFVTEAKAKNIILDNSSLHHEINVSMLSYSGISLLDEPFFRNCLEAIIENNVRYLREKARIKIPRNHGRLMFGVLDDINTYDAKNQLYENKGLSFSLKENQVFIQITDEDDPKRKMVITGPVMVTKFPCMHPGDIRILEAVDVPSLRHLKDCIVFPAVGKRPIPDQMAGSDLDGDEYAVVWNSKLFPKIQNYDPADYSAPKAKKLNREITVNDMIMFQSDYIRTYSIGRIANAHLAWADSKEKGIFDELCFRLAQKYAISLDFAKTGVNNSLTREEMIKDYPDFMEKHEIKNFYVSRRILGDLYRQIRLVELGIVDEFPVLCSPYCNELLVHKEWKRYEQSAMRAYQKYATLVKNLQNQFKVDSESALLLGFPDKFAKLCASSEKTREIGYKIQELVKNLFSIIRNDFEKEFTEARDYTEERLAKASAYYMVTFHSRNKIKYFGLPWIFSEYLSQLAIKKRANFSGKMNEKELTFLLMDAIDEKCDCDSDDKIIRSVQHLFDNWIKAQKDYQFGLHISQQLIENEIDNEIDLHWHLFMCSGERISPGKFVLKILSKFAKRVIYLDKKYVKDGTKEVSTKSNGTRQFLGIYSLITLNKMYKTKSVACFVSNYIAILQNVTFKQYCLSFGRNKTLKKFITRNEEKFKTVIEQISAVDCAYGRWFESGFDYSYYIVAFGSKCALETLNMVIAEFLANPKLV
ncbi:RNA-dependent RNA polymerase 1-like protein, partial [Dinothrombium tinctorium]